MATIEIILPLLLVLYLAIPLVLLLWVASLSRRLRRLEQEVAEPRARPAAPAGPWVRRGANIPPEVPAEAPPEAAEAPQDDASAQPPQTPAEPAPPATEPAAKPRRGRLEERLAASWMVWLGGVTVALAAVFLFRYAIEEGWLTPFARVAAGLVLGGLLLAAGEWTQRRPLRLGAHAVAPDHVPAALSAAGIFAVFVALWAAHGLYGLMGPATAFAALALTAWSALGLSLRQGWFVAALGIAGGYLMPLLVASAEPNAVALFLHLFALTLGALGVMVWRRWWWFAFLTLAGALVWPWLWALAPATPGDRLVLGLYATGLAAALGVLSLRLPLPEPGRPAWRWIAATLGETGGLGFALTGMLMIHLAVQAGFDAASVVFLLAYGGVALGLGLWEPRREGLFPVAAVVALLAMMVWPAADGVPLAPSVEAGAARSAWPLGLPEALGLFARALAGLAVLFGLGGFLALPRIAARPVWAGVSALIPLLLFALGYWRIAAFEVATDWGALALGLALAALAAATVLRRTGWPEADTLLALYAAAVTAALALAFACVLREAWLSVALAAEVAALGWIWSRLGVPALKGIAVALLAVVAVRLVANPWVLDYEGGIPGAFGWVVYGYGLPAAAMVAAARLFGGDRRELTVTLCEIAATAFAFLMVALQLRLWTSGSLDAGRWELLDGGVQALWWMLAGAALLDPRFAEGRRWAPPAGTAAVAAGTALVLFWLLTDRNPLLVPTPVGRWPLVNLLGLAYLAPALILAGLAIDRRRAIGDGWRLAFAATAGVLIFVWLTLEVRRAFWGSEIALFLRPPSAAEVYAYSAAWIAYALALLALGLWRGSRALRYASLAVLMATVAKVFLYDMSGLTGLWRVASFLGLGLTLIGIGRVYGLHILPAERRAPEQP